jgi:cell division protein FtsB
MGILQEIRARARHVVGPVLGVCAVGYFAYHVVHGDRGLIQWWNIKQRVQAAKAVLADTRAERDILENRVQLMNPGSLDPDMLEERARLMLNYGHSDDIIVLEGKRRK